jgi:hypothetical protein
MRYCLPVLLVTVVAGCDSKPVKVPAKAPEERRRVRPIPLDKPIRTSAPVVKVKPPQPDDPKHAAPYTYGDLVHALQEDAKAKEYRATGGAVGADDPRIFRPDARHEGIRNIINQRYNEEITLANVLKLREELRKANPELTAADVDKIPLTEVVDAFGKSEQ